MTKFKNKDSFDALSLDSKTRRQSTGFTQISNNVINNIKDADAFLVWCYLYSKPSTWKTIKSNIKNVYGFGDAKMAQIFSYLRRANLIEYVQEKCANGKFAQVVIVVLNGLDFDKNQPFKENAPLPPKTAPTVNRTNGNDELINKDNNKYVKENNTKSNSASVDAHVPLKDGFDDFWKIYPVKKNKVRSKRIWERKKLYKIHELILKDLSLRKSLDAQWKEPQFIPHPSTYLQNELWNDDLMPEVTKPSTKTNGGDALSRVINKHLKNNGETYDQYGNTYDPLR